jgi:enoyl-CoA hydratase/carnithine racemase
MPSSNVAWDINESVAIVTLNRPAARNAMTWEMYDALVEACDAAEANSEVRVLIIRGSGGAFAAGTDISQFREFDDGDDGVNYERRLDAVIDRIERLTIATIAEIDGAAAGGGCAIAMACDLRICSERARFGVPVARTLGNCLSGATTGRLVDIAGPARAKEMLFTGRLLPAADAYAYGLINRIVTADQIEKIVRELATEMAGNAPLTIRASKEMIRRIAEHRRLPAGRDHDLVEMCYLSEDFREAVRAFAAKNKPRWTGR